MKAIRFFAVLILLAGCSSSYSPMKLSTAPAPPPPFPVRIVELRGDGTELGAQHAQQLGEPIRNLFHIYFDQYFTSSLQRSMAMGAAGMFESFISPQHRDEV